MSEHELWNEVGNLYFKTGSFDQAIGAYTRAIDLDQGFGRSYTNMAVAYVKVGKHAEAISLYHRALDLMTDEYERAFTWYKLGNVYRHIKDYALALAAFQKADELAGAQHHDEDSVDSFDALLTSKRAADDVIKVLNLEEQVIEQAQSETITTPFDGVEGYVYLEEFTPWIFEGQNAPEEEPIEADFEFIPEDVLDNADLDEVIPMIEPLKWEISSDLELGNEESFVDGAVEDDETPPVDVTSLTEMLMRECLPTVEAWSPDQAPKAEMIDSLISDQEQMEFDPVTEVAANTEVFTAVPEFVAEDVTAAQSIQDEGPQTEAMSEEESMILEEIRRVQRVLDTNPQNAFAWDTLGGLYKSIGRYFEAIEAYQTAVSLDPSRSYYVYHLGLVYAAENRIDEAIAAFEKVVELNPNHSHAHATLGGYYRKQGREDLAQVHIERARGLLDESENEYNRACMEAICGNSDRALDLLEVALKNKQTHTTWARKDPDLEFIRSDSRFGSLLSGFEMGLAG